MPVRDVIQHLQPEMRRHLRICKCAVKAAAGWKTLVLHEGTQLVARGIGIDTPGRKHGAGEFSRVALLYLLQLCLEETLVKRGIVGNQVKILDELAEFSHHILAGRGITQHGIGDAGIVFDEGVYPPAGIHQLLEAVTDPAILNAHRADFDGPVSLVRRQTAGLEIKNNDRISLSLAAPVHRNARSILSVMLPYCALEF